MIESKNQVLSAFREKARVFLAEPNPINGIDLDDAAVTLKRYALSVMHDEELGIALGRFQKLIRELDVDGVSKLVGEVESRLAD